MQKNILFLSILTVFLCSATVYANDQQFAAGFGLGISSYKTDEGKTLGLGFDQDKNRAGFNEFIEWYLLGNLGFGLKANFLVAANNDTTITEGTYEYKYEELFAVSSVLLTANLVLIGSESYFRVGVNAGYGYANYSYYVDETVYNSGTYDSTSTDDTTGSGTSTMAGVYLDWGGDVFGMRLGYELQKYTFDEFTILENSKARTIDLSGSGSGGYLTFRWAW